MVEKTSNRESGLAVIALLLLLAVALLVTAYGYEGGSGLLPRFVGWIFVVLATIEFSLQLKNYLVNRASTSDETARTAGRARVAREVKGLLWIGFFLAALYVAGFMLAIPLYIFAFLRLSGGYPWRACAALAASAAVFVYVLFVQLLDYRLFPGVLFGS